MSLPRLGLSLAVGLSTGLGLAWLVSRITWGEHATDRLEPGVPYAVEVSSNRCELDLAFDGGTQYLLVVSSLGSAVRSFDVDLESAEVANVERLAARRVDFWDDDPVRHQRLGPGAPGSKSARLSPEAPPAEIDTPGVRAALESVSRSAPVPAARRKPPAEKTFFLHVADGSLDDENQYVEVKGRLLTEGRDVRVYLDRQQPKEQLAPGVVEEILRLLDDEIVPTTRQHLGIYRDVDGDGGFTVLISPWLDRLQGGRTSLGGFVRGADFRGDVSAPFSNRCDMLYLNASIRPGPHLKSLLAHEYAHAVCFSERLPLPANPDGLPDEEDWLNEAIAHCAENVCAAGWSNLDYRVSRYLNDPGRYPLVVPDYYRAGLWRDHGCRGATYLFLRWCVDQFGEDFLQKLVHSPRQGIPGLESATGRKFDELFRRWSLALIQPQYVRADSRTRALNSAGEQVSAGERVSVGERAGSQDGYRFLNLYGRLASWGLAGPRTETWHVDTGARRIAVKGTATSFIALRANPQGGFRRISLRAENGTRLQASIVRIPADRLVLKAEAHWCPRQSPTNSEGGSTAPRIVRVNVRGAGRAELTIETVACEWNSGETKQSHCFTTSELGSFEETRAASGGDAAAGRSRCFCLPVRDPCDEREDLVIKVCARDADGRPLCAWATLPCVDESHVQARAEIDDATAIR